MCCPLAPGDSHIEGGWEGQVLQCGVRIRSLPLVLSLADWKRWFTLNLARDRAFTMPFPYILTSLPHHSCLAGCTTPGCSNACALNIGRTSFCDIYCGDHRSLIWGLCWGEGYMLELVPRLTPAKEIGRKNHVCLILGSSFILEMEAGQPKLHLKMHKDVSMWEKRRMFSSWP